MLNHLPDEASVKSLVSEVARVLAPTGIFIFDINTARGLQYTSEMIEVHSGRSDQTVWARHWDGERLVLNAHGSFDDGETSYRYDERIEKLVIPVNDIAAWCAAAGLLNLVWTSDDLLTELDDPEEHAAAFGIARFQTTNPAPSLSSGSR